MRMKEFYEARGMKASWEYESHSATEGHPRYGVIRKVMKVPADWRGEKKSLVGVTINTEDDTIRWSGWLGVILRCQIFFGLCWQTEMFGE